MQADERTAPRLDERRAAVAPVRPARVHQRANVRVVLRVLAGREAVEGAAAEDQRVVVRRRVGDGGLEVGASGVADAVEGGFGRGSGAGERDVGVSAR